MQLFWERGYEQTSLQDLEARTGLSRSSLYNTFNSKHALFTLALDRYREQLHDRVLADLEAGTAGLGDLHRFVDAVGAGLADPEVAWGCLMINSLAEFGGRDADVVRYGQAYMEQFRSAIAGGLDRAANLGEIDPATVDGRTLLLLGLVLGVNVVGRSGVGQAATAALIDAIHAEVDSWRLPRAARGRANRNSGKGRSAPGR